MLPRRAYLPGEHHNPWTQMVWLGLFPAKDRHLWIISMIFDCLLLFALLIFLIWSYAVRQPKGRPRSLPIGAIASSLLSFLACQITRVIIDVFWLVDIVVMQHYIIALMLRTFFLFLGFCIAFYVFYKLIHRFLERLTGEDRPYAVVNAVHSVLLGVLALIAIATWVLSVAYMCHGVKYNSADHLYYVYIRVASAQSLVFWIASLEILGWSVFVMMKTGTHQLISRVPAAFLLIGSVFYFGVNLMFAVATILYGLKQMWPLRCFYPIQAAVTFFCFGGFYAGILMYCMKWNQLGLDVDDDSYSKEQVLASSCRLT